MSIQLSISLLASNRRESVARCLDSLKPLLMRIPSELIVVLTEKNQEIYEIASLYTDQIIPFVWCNDFSAARNAGLKIAKGEWFLYIDDDEWFEDPAEICDFFNSEENRHFNSASYIVRNYQKWDGVQYIDVHVCRMIRMNPEIHFQSPIHENLTPIKGPRKYFNTYVHHYGYVENTSRANFTKTSRNIPLLISEISKQPSNIKNYLQIVQEFIAEKKWRQAEEYCRNGLSFCSKHTPEAYRNWLGVHLTDILYEKGDLAEAKREILNILRTERLCELVQLILYSDLVIISSKRKEKPKDILRYGLEFEQLLAYMDENPELWGKQRYGDLNEQLIRDPGRLLSIRLSCAEAAMERLDYEKTKYFLEFLPWEEECQMQHCYPVLDRWKKNYKSIFEEILKVSYGKSPYFILQKALDVTGLDEKKELLLQCAMKTQTIYLQVQIIKEAIRTEIRLSFMAEIMDLEKWKQCTIELIKDLPAKYIDKASRLSKILENDFPLHGRWLTKLQLEKKLTVGCYMPSELPDVFTKYCNAVVCFYKEIFQEHMLDNSMGNCLPHEYQYAVSVLKAIENVERNELVKAIGMLCTAIRYRSFLMGATNELIRFIKKGMNNPGQNVGEEFLTLAAQLKSALYTLLEQGMYTEAMSILTQLMALLPEDLELLRIRQRLIRSME